MRFPPWQHEPCEACRGICFAVPVNALIAPHDKLADAPAEQCHQVFADRRERLQAAFAEAQRIADGAGGVQYRMENVGLNFAINLNG